MADDQERTALIMPPRRNIIRLALITASILLVPLVGMQFSDEVDWSLPDFVVAGALLFGTGFALELIVRNSTRTSYRTATGLACAAALLLIWINLAVGFIGSEDNPANMLYLGVLMIGGVGVVVARLRPLGMSRVLFTMAVVQAAVPVVAMVIWRSPVAVDQDLGGLAGVFLLNAFFALLFVASAVLYRRAGDAREPS